MNDFTTIDNYNIFTFKKCRLLYNVNINNNKIIVSILKNYLFYILDFFSTNAKWEMPATLGRFYIC